MLFLVAALNDRIFGGAKLIHWKCCYLGGSEMCAGQGRFYKAFGEEGEGEGLELSFWGCEEPNGWRHVRETFLAGGGWC